MTADYRFFCFRVEIDRAHDAGVCAFTAANTFFRFQQHTASRTFLKRLAWTHFHARWLITAETHYRDKAA